MLTTGSNVFRCTRAQAREVAVDWMELRHEVSSTRDDPYEGCGSYKLGTYDFEKGRMVGGYDLWQDAYYGGGMCRIVWSEGLAWVSRHSGYWGQDQTEDARMLFEMLGCEPVDSRHRNPHIYG